MFPEYAATLSVCVQQFHFASIQCKRYTLYDGNGHKVLQHLHNAGMLELVDRTDLKSVRRKPMGIRFPLPAPFISPCYDETGRIKLIHRRHYDTDY